MSAAARRYVDMWAFPGMHPTNIDVLQRLKSADDRQFGTHMDICGTVSQLNAKTSQWEQICLAGIRNDIWNPDKSELEKTLRTLQNQRRRHHRRQVKKSGALSERQQQELERHLSQDQWLSLSVDDIEKRRLVLKLFRTTGQRMKWTGTIEEVTTREIHNSLGSRRALLSVVTILPGYKYMTIVQENHRTFRIPPIYTFCFQDAKSGRNWYVNIKRKWFSIGADYVMESAGQPIGEIDGKLIGFGYNAYVTVHEPTLAANGDFLDLVTLFATSVGYHRAMRRSVRKRIKAARAGDNVGHLIEDEEFWLLKNPRRHAA